MMAEPHGSFEQRGMKLVAKDRNAEGRFGLMFKHLKPFAPPRELLQSLAATMVQQPGPAAPFENATIPAGFTFCGQFIDHDITRDELSDLEKQQDPDGLTNFRTPIFDMDSVYGGGPTARPELYDGPKLRLSTEGEIDEDLLRGPDGIAQIGDHRNEENLIIAQLQIAMIKFHNAMVDHVQQSGTGPDRLFAEAQRLAQFHYQWVVLTDFMVRTCGADIVDSVLKKPSGNSPIRADLRFYKPRQTPFMPVEFSVAAYRFGHSQIRPGYRINQTHGAAFFQPEAGDANLNGFRPIPGGLKIHWPFFFEVSGSADQPQKSMMIDSKLSAPLFNLPFGDPPKSLAERNLLRSNALGLPSGQAVAEEMGVPRLSNSDLGIADDPGWENQCPLWFYILKEAELQRNGGTSLGQVGGRIVAETLVGLLAENQNSFFKLGPNFQPEPPIAPAKGEFKMGDLLRFAGAI